MGLGKWKGSRKLKGYMYLEKVQKVGMGTGNGMRTGIWNRYRNLKWIQEFGMGTGCWNC